MKRLLLLTLLIQGLKLVNAQTPDSSLNYQDDPDISNVETKTIEGETVHLKKQKLRGTISMNSAIRYKDRIYIIGNADKYIQFTFLFIMWEAESFNTNIFILEYDTNINFIKKHNIDIAPSKKEYILQDLSIHQIENKILCFFSIQNKLKRKKIFMVNSFDLETKETKRVKISEMPLKSKDRIQIINDRQSGTLVMDYMKEDDETGKFASTASISIDKELNITENTRKAESYEKVYATCTDNHTGATYSIIKKDNRQQLAVYHNSNARYYTLSTNPEKDEILDINLDPEKQELFVTIYSKSAKFNGYSLYRIVIGKDSISETHIKYISQNSLDAMDIFKKHLTAGYKDVTDAEYKEIEKLKKYYYRQTIAFDYTTKTLLLFHTFHREYTTVVREETKHYRTDRNGRQYYTHSTFTNVYKDRYVNGPVVMTRISDDGEPRHNLLNLVEDRMADIPIDLRLTRTGPGKILLSSSSSVFTIDLQQGSVTRLNAYQPLGTLYENVSVIPLDNDFLILQQSRTMFKLSMTKAVH